MFLKIKIPVTATRQAMHFHFGASVPDIQFVYRVSRSAIRNSVHCVGDCTAQIRWENRPEEQREAAKVAAWFELMNTGNPVLSRRALIFTGQIRTRFEQKELFEELSARGWTAHEISERLSLISKVIPQPQLCLFEG